MYQMSFVMLRGEELIHKWTCSEKFDSKEAAMKFAQNTAKAFNGSPISLFYCIIWA